MRDNGRRETQRRGKKHEHPAELTFQFIDRCCCCVICEVDRVGRYYSFQNINFPHLDLAIWANEKGKYQIKTGSVDSFENCSRVMDVVVVSLPKMQTATVIFQMKQSPKYDIGSDY